MLKALIVGCGYVGNALASRLTARGEEVVAVARHPRPDSPGMKWLALDVANRELSSIPRDVNALVYMASPDEITEAAYRRTYVGGLRNVLRALTQADIRHAIFVSSTVVYEDSSGEWIDENSKVAPSHFRGAVLVEAEQTLAASTFPSTVVRFAGIYGPGREGMIQRIRSGAARRPRRARFANRIHRDDCAGILDHLLRLSRPEPLYVGVDCDPCDVRIVMDWIATRLGCQLLDAEESENSSGRFSTHKRCRNSQILASGYEFIYPTFREGYGELLGG